jgi:hypothetical protein
MITPSEIHQPRVYTELDPEAIAHYLVANGWKCIYEEDGRFLGMRWFHHLLSPRWPDRELVTNRTLPFALSCRRDDNAPREFDDIGTLIRVGAKRLRDYPQLNRQTLLDLEAHENRWIGHIITDIQAMDAALRAPSPVAA